MKDARHPILGQAVDCGVLVIQDAQAVGNQENQKYTASTRHHRLTGLGAFQGLLRVVQSGCHLNDCCWLRIRLPTRGTEYDTVRIHTESPEQAASLKLRPLQYTGFMVTREAGSTSGEGPNGVPTLKQTSALANAIER